MVIGVKCVQITVRNVRFWCTRSAETDPVTYLSLRRITSPYLENTIFSLLLLSIECEVNHKNYMLISLGQVQPIFWQVPLVANLAIVTIRNSVGLCLRAARMNPKKLLVSPPSFLFSSFSLFRWTATEFKFGKRAFSTFFKLFFQYNLDPYTSSIKSIY
jgi:hypothetical protein